MYKNSDNYDYEKKDIDINLSTKIIGKNIIIFDEIDSTNKFLKENSKEIDEGTVVLAKRQTNGYGRRGNSWAGTEGGVFLSILLKPDKVINDSARISLVTALSIKKTLIETELPIEIKWPNDLLINGKKICGILTEIVNLDEGEDVLVLGIGLNVNNTHFPLEISKIATSLKIEKEKKENFENINFDTAKIIASICKNIEIAYYTYLSDGFSFFLEEYRKNCINIGKKVKILCADKNFEQGTVLDINKDGSILFEDEFGKIKNIFSGEISIKVDI